MAEKFTIDEVTGDNFTSIMLISALTKMDEDSTSLFSIDEAAKKKSLEVELRIGGHEYSMREFLKKLEDAFDYSTTKKALQISEERCGNILSKLSEFETAVSRIIRLEFPEIHEDQY